MNPILNQVASQQGDYLARCFNKMKKAEEHPEGPVRIREPGRHRFRPFRYITYSSCIFIICLELHLILSFCLIYS